MHSPKAFHAGLSLLLSALAAPVYALYPGDSPSPVKTLAFGSCNRDDLEQWQWKALAAEGCDVWIWGGDNVYGKDYDAEDLKAAFSRQSNRPDYAEFRSSTKVIGTWDDHDYGINNGDRTNPYKAKAQQWLLDFLEEPGDSPRRSQEGIYTAFTFGTPPECVRVILLDARYHAEAPGAKADLLGEAQWKWLRAELSDHRASLTLVVSGIQVLPTEHRFEKWANHPQSRERLLKTLCEVQTPGVIFLSGDRHTGELSLQNDIHTPYPLYELTSSSLTHSWTDRPAEQNSLRVGKVCRENNLGLIRLNWQTREVSLELLAQDGKRVIRQTLPLENLTPSRD